MLAHPFQRRKDFEISEDFAGVRETIIRQVNEAALCRIEGWDSLAAFAERAVLDGVEITSTEGANGKWFARGVVSLGLLNWDEKRFGKVRLHLIVSGHLDGSEVSVDSLLISPNMH